MTKISIIEDVTPEGNLSAATIAEMEAGAAHVRRKEMELAAARGDVIEHQPAAVEPEPEPKPARKGRTRKEPAVTPEVTVSGEPVSGEPVSEEPVSENDEDDFDFTDLGLDDD